jgi:hypothetical protein
MKTVKHVRIGSKEYYQVYEVENRQQLTDEEVTAVWLSREENRVMRQEALDMLDRLKSGRLRPSDERRGLEHLSYHSQFMRRKQICKEALCAVMVEQENQWDKRQSDPKRIRAVYASFTSPATEEAIERAQKDYICLQDDKISNTEAGKYAFKAKHLFDGNRRRRFFQRFFLVMHNDDRREQKMK